MGFYYGKKRKDKDKMRKKKNRPSNPWFESLALPFPVLGPGPDRKVIRTGRAGTII